MINQNITIEKNMTAYNLIVGEYIDQYYEKERVYFTWLKNGMSGETISWEKGDVLYVDSLSCKATNINRADMTGILTVIKERFPGLIKRIVVPEDFKCYQ